MIWFQLAKVRVTSFRLRQVTESLPERTVHVEARGLGSGPFSAVPLGPKTCTAYKIVASVPCHSVQASV